MNKLSFLYFYGLGSLFFEMLLIFHQIFNKSLVGVDHVSLALNIILCIIEAEPELFHHIGNHQRRTS